MSALNNSVDHINKLSKYRNLIAALSSILPGLGHLYKGYLKEGFTILIISPLFIWAGLILGFATGGVGLLVPIIYLVVVGWHAYTVDDHRNHPLGLI